MFYRGLSFEVEKEITLIKMQAAAYGKCIVADYNSVHKDKCVTEFLRLKDCYLVSVVVVLPLASTDF